MNYRELFRVEGLPVFQNKMFADQASAINCVKGDVVLVQDMDTGLIFNAAFDPELLQYDQDYQNEQAHSSIFRDHLANVKQIIQRHFGQGSIIEVGCGKGYFLEHLLEAGYDITGIDPAYEGENERVVKACFAPDLGLTADAVVLRHVLEHIQNPYQFLRQIAETNGNQGKIYIEVPCFDWICDHRAWFDIFYEHVNYFRLADFGRLFGKVYEAGHVFGGQYLYVVADIASLKEPKLNEEDAFAFPEDFVRSAFAIKENRHNENKNKRIAWGASSKGVILALYMQRIGCDIDFLIDINPAKQNRYIAYTGLKVLGPQEGISQMAPSDEVYIMNPNYFEEIELMINRKDIKLVSL